MNINVLKLKLPTLKCFLGVSRVRFWHKGLGLILLAAMLLAAPTVLVIQKFDQELATATLEKSGGRYAKETFRLIELVQEYYGLSGMVLSGEQAMTSKWQAKVQQIDAQIAVLDSLDQQVPELRLSDGWQSVRSNWLQLKKNAAGLAVEAHLKQQALMIDKLFRFNQKLLGSSGLMQDNQLTDAYWMMVYMNQLPELSEILGLIRVRGERNLLTETVSDVERAKLQSLLILLVNKQALLQENAPRFTKLYQQLRFDPHQQLEEVGALVNIVEGILLQAETLRFSSQDYYSLMTNVLNYRFLAHDDFMNALDSALEQRISETYRLKYGLLAGLLGLFALWVGLSYWVFRSVIRPINMTAEALTRLGRGELPVSVELSNSVEFAPVQKGLNDTIKAIKSLTVDTGLIAQAVSQGNLNFRTCLDGYQGIFRTIMSEVNACPDALNNPLDMISNRLELIAHGQLPLKITEHYEGGMQRLVDNLNTGIDALNTLVTHIDGLLDNIRNGELDARLEIGRNQGEYRRMFENINASLELVVKPLQYATEVSISIAQGNFRRLVSDDLNGGGVKTCNKFDDGLNVLNSLLFDLETLTTQIIDGHLEVRSDPNQYPGDYCKLLEDLNKTLDAVTQPLLLSSQYLEQMAKGNMPSKVQENYSGDFNTLKLNLNKCVDYVNALVVDQFDKLF